MSSRWTENSVRIACGLQPWDTFALKQEERLKAIRKEHSENSWLEQHTRRTGKTTRMICQALASSANGENTVIVSKNRAMTQHMYRMIQMYREGGNVPERGEVEIITVSKGAHLVLVDNAVWVTPE